MDAVYYIDVKNNKISKSHFCSKMRVFDKNGPKNTFLPTWHFHIMPNLKIDISNFVMTHDVGVCGVGKLNRPLFRFAIALIAGTFEKKNIGPNGKDGLVKLCVPKFAKFSQYLLSNQIHRDDRLKKLN